MVALRDLSYTFRVELDDLERFGFDSLLYGDSIQEDRARTLSLGLGDSAVELCCLTLSDEAILTLPEFPSETFNIYQSSELGDLIDRLDGVVAIDLTSLEHRVWAPLIRTLLERGRTVFALYVEPADYRRHDDEAGSIYDLSSTRGIEPLPGFARLARRPNGESSFAPLLGFEGARLKYIFDQEDVDTRVTSPVVGVPGFRLEYSMHSFVANRDILEQDRMEGRVELAAANCPFEAFHALERIHLRSGSEYLRVAPIGTKPHALGSVLYAIENSTSVELIYDHPVRSSNRTAGSRSIYVYDISGFVEERRRLSNAS